MKERKQKMARLILLITSAMLIGASSAHAQLVVVEKPDSVTVSSSGSPQWKAVVDRARGGAISQFHLPADGPNVIANEAGNPFRGMFSLFYMTRLPGDAPEEQRVKAKGTLWGTSGGSAQLKVLSRNEKEVVIETRGKGTGWRMIGPRGEIVAEYTQTYTFRPDRIICGGELTWVYPYQTRLVEMALETFFAPDAVFHPVHLLHERDQSQRTELALTTSHGQRLPDGIQFPMGYEVRLKNGHRLEFRTLQMPALVEKARWYFLERQWQQEWSRAIAWIGKAEKPEDEIPPGKPVPYRYEMVMSKLSADQTPPRVVITSPARERKHQLGETVTFTATATDAQGNKLSNVRWDVYHGWSMAKPVKQYAGLSFSHTIPATLTEFRNDHYIIATATAMNAAGLKSVEYITVNIEPPPNTLTNAETKTGWKLLFDGKTTAGWRGYKMDKMPPGWEVSDGALVRVKGGAGGKGAGGGDDIVTTEEFENFDLSLEWKLMEKGNSGVLYHVSEEPVTAWHYAPEVQIWTTNATQRKTRGTWPAPPMTSTRRPKT